MQEKFIEGFQLSPQQRHLWLLQKGDSSLPYRVESAILIEGNLNTGDLKAALENVVMRHEVFRTTFRCLPGMTIPLQVITDVCIPLVHDVNLGTLDTPEQDARIQALFHEARQMNFNFEEGPLLQLSIVTLSPYRHILLVTSTALCADAGGIRNLVNEISRSYTACLHGEELSDQVMQYVDFSTWQNELLEAEDTEGGREYWRRQDIAPLIARKLPFENQSPEESGFAPQTLNLTIKPDIVQKIRAIVRRYDASTSVFLLACWQTLLYRLTGEANVIIGTACDGRNYEELKKALGLFTRYLPLLCQTQEHLKFIEILEQVKKSASEISQWQEYFNWEQIVGANENSMNTSFFPFCFDFEEQPEKYSVGDLTISISNQYACVDRFKVKFSGVLKNDALIADFHYDSNLYQKEDIKRMAGHFQALLESVIDNPESPMIELQILNDLDRQQLLVEFNNNRKEYPKDKFVHQLFEAHVEHAPDNIAAVFEGQSLTYAELNARANQLARHLQKIGVGPEVMVALCVERSLEMIIGLLSILKAGGAYVPLDPVLPKERLAVMLEETQAPVLVTQQHLAGRLPEYGGHVVCLDSNGETIAGESRENTTSGVMSSNLVYVLFTSGSTGRPKGVAVEHQQILNYVYAITERLDLPPKASFAMVSTFATDLGNTAIFPALCSGGCLHIVSQERASDPHSLADYFHRYRIDCLKIVPSHLDALLSSHYSGNILPLKRLVLGGDACSWELIDKVQTLAPNCIIFNHYGPTETTVGVAARQVDNHRTTRLPMIPPIGRPIANTQIYLLDAQRQPVPILVPGEIHIGGANLARGYLNRPELTAERFIPNPFSDEPQERLYKTGDMGRYLPGGDIEFLGRNDQQVKIRGYRIEIGEIEAILSRHPSVRKTVVIAREDVPGEKQLVAYCVSSNKQDASSGELRHFLKEKLPEYMMPSAFILMDAFPLTSNGKVDRQALPSPEQAMPEPGETQDTPRTPIESLIAEIWQEVLNVDRVGVNDNFFDLGGHSLLSLQVVARLEKKIGLRINPGEMIFQTLGQLASVCEERMHHRNSAVKQ